MSKANATIIVCIFISIQRRKLDNICFFCNASSFINLYIIIYNKKLPNKMFIYIHKLRMDYKGKE